MEEEQIITVNDLSSEEGSNKEKGSGVNKALMGIIVFLLLIITGSGAYFFGTAKNDGETDEAAPTESPFKAETLGEEIEEEVIPTTAGEATPTTDPSITPSITPTTTASPTIYINPNLKVKDEFKIMLPTSTPTPSI